MSEIGGKFSAGGSRYCSLQGGGAGRARLWSNRGGAPEAEITPDAHLAAPLSCFAWLRLQRQTEKRWKSRKRKNSSEDVDDDDDRDDDSTESTHLAFGTTSGKILVYSLAEAAFETTLEDESSEAGDRRVVCLDWDRRHGLYGCSADSTVRQWSIADNAVRGKFNMEKRCRDAHASVPTRIKLVPNVKGGHFNKHKLMLSASYRIRLWCLNSMTVLRTMIGHSSEVCLLDVVCFPNDSKLYAVSGSKNDRILSFWGLSVTQEELALSQNGNDSDPSDDSKHRKKASKKKNKSEPVEAISNPNCNFLMEDIARMISCSTEGKSQNTIKLSAVTRSGVVHFYEHTLNGLLSKPLKPITTLQIATEVKDGSVKPSPILCCALNNDGTIQIGYNLGLGMIFERVVPNASEKMNVLIRVLEQKTKSVKERNAESATKLKLANSKDNSVVFLSSVMSQGDQKDLKRPLGGKQGDVPMESRLANLSLAKSGSVQASDNNNLAQLLVQALHSKDTKLLQTVFECKDPDTAYSSVNRLPIQYVSPLLDHLIEMLRGKSSHCRSACIWAYALCKAKSSTLLALSSSGSDKVKELRSALAARLPCLSELLALRGRVLLALHKSAENASTPVDQAPLLDYKDSSSEDEMPEDMDDAIVNSSDVETWNEDEDDDEEDAEEEEEENDDGDAAEKSPKESDDENMSEDNENDPSDDEND